MSVDELIHKLAEWPGNFEVYAHNINGDYRRVEYVEKDEPYVGDYGLTVSDNEDECEFTVAINYCPKCGRELTNQSTAQ